jgi:hypothetical protein
MKFLETLLHPDREDNPDRSLVAEAANILQVGEFQLLQLAYHQWHGRDMDGQTADRIFQTFMIQGRLPVWARHYGRHIIDLDREGALDEDACDYHRYDSDYYRANPPHGMRRFVVAATLVVGAIGGGLVLAHYSASCDGSVLPPCFDSRAQSAGDDDAP